VSLVLERHAPATEIPNDGAQRAEPPGAEDDVVPGQRHDVEIGRKRHAVDEQGRVADDAGTGDPLAIGDQGGETGALAKGQPGTPRRRFGDEVVRAAGVQKGDEGRGT
jgi:hypothetical protein